MAHRPRAVAGQAPPIPADIAPVATPKRAVPLAPWSPNAQWQFFSQLAPSANAGVSMGHALETMSKHSYKRAQQVRCAEWAQKVNSGEPLYKVLAEDAPTINRWSYSMVRVGEMAGCLPEALEMAAKQNMESHKFNRFFWFYRLALYYGVLAIPLTMALMKGYVEAYKAFEKEGGTVFGQLAHHMGKNLVWPYGPGILLTWAIMFLFTRWVMSPLFERFRHGWALYHPYMRGMARSEALRHFLWALHHLSRAGLSPFSCWNLAADAVPNAILRDQFLDLSRKARETTSLSELVAGSRLFPPETLGIIRIGEETGTLPQALAQQEELATLEFGRNLTQSKSIWVISGVLLLTIIGLCILALLCYFWYVKFYGAVLDGLESRLFVPISQKWC